MILDFQYSNCRRPRPPIMFNHFEKLEELDIRLSCPFSKDTVYTILNQNKIALHTPDDDTYWFPTTFAFDQYSLYIEGDFHILPEDIISINATRYSICSIDFEDEDQYYATNNKETCKIIIKNLNTEEYTEINATNFMKMMEEDNIVYEYSVYLD